MSDHLPLKVDLDVPARMRDGTTLRADIYRPDTSNRVPVLLTRTPYDKSQASGRWLGLDPIRASAAGYAVVVQDVRGRYSSDGIFYPFKNELSDGHDTVEWCATQPWSTGEIGMYGRSYCGATQWLTAISGPPHLKTIVPGITSSSYYEGWTYQGGAFELGFSVSWATNQLVLANLKRLSAQVQDAGNDQELLIDAIDNLSDTMRHLPLKEFPVLKRPGVAPFYYDWLDHPSADDYWQRWEVEAHYDAVLVPALHFGGWYDIFLGGTLKNFKGMQEKGGSPEARKGQKLIVGPWLHSTPFSHGVGEVDFGLRANQLAIDLEGIHLKWFDYWLKGKDNGIMSEDPVNIFVMGPNRWRNESQWPPQDVEYVNYYLRSNGHANTLTGDGVLSINQPSDEPPDSYVYDPSHPVPTKGGSLCCNPTQLPGGAFDQRDIEDRSDVLVYSTPKLDKNVEVTGPISVTLYAASSAQDTDFTAKLVDVCNCGCIRNLTDGIIRARYNESRTTPTLIKPGKVYRYNIDLWATSNLFKQGHRIRVEISSSNFPRFDANPNTGEPFGATSNITSAIQSVRHDTKHPSHITLPLIER